MEDVTECQYKTSINMWIHPSLPSALRFFKVWRAALEQIYMMFVYLHFEV